MQFSQLIPGAQLVMHYTLFIGIFVYPADAEIYMAKFQGQNYITLSVINNNNTQIKLQ